MSGADKPQDKRDVLARIHMVMGRNAIKSENEEGYDHQETEDNTNRLELRISHDYYGNEMW